MSKIVCIGDIHGRNIWKDILDNEKDFDEVVFLGDYFDNRDGIGVDKEISNFKDILNYKANNPNIKVTILIGNHDLHYLPNAKDICSGYSKTKHRKLSNILANWRDIFTSCYRSGDYLFSHAGISSVFLAYIGVKSDDNMVDNLNKIFRENPNIFRFNPICFNPYGDDIAQSPLWIRPYSLKKANMGNDYLLNLTQVVGHTDINVLRESAISYEYIDELISGDVSYVYNDGLSSGEYLTIEDGKIYFKSTKLWQK